MKKIIRNFFAFLAILLIVDLLFNGFDITSIWTYFLLAIILAVTQFLLEPIITFFTVPANNVTFALFLFVFSIVYFYFFGLFLPGFKLSDGSIGPLVTQQLQVPVINMSIYFVLVFAGLLVAILDSIITWTTNG